MGPNRNSHGSTSGLRVTLSYLPYTMLMKKLQHIRVTAFRDALENLWKIQCTKGIEEQNTGLEIETGISLLPILFACEITIKFNSTFFFFDENIQIICLKWIFKEFVCKLKQIIIESYTESNESLQITRLRNPIVCSGLFLKQT